VSRNLWANLDYVPFNGRIVSRFITDVVNEPESYAGQDQSAKGEGRPRARRRPSSSTNPLSKVKRTNCTKQLR
jgi:hypothetical protein